MKAKLEKTGTELLFERLKKLSLEERTKGEVNNGPGLNSQYQLNYRPMSKGVRVRLWEEGFKYRGMRKRTGFTHTKIEWNVPTFRR